MAEKKRPLDVTSGSGSGGGLFGGGVFTDGGGMAVVQSNVYEEPLPVVGMTIRQIRALFGARLDIAPTARGLVGGTEVGDDHVVQQGQTVAFVRRSGEKGRVVRTETGALAWTCSI